jgi:hypothetical protein
MADTPYEINLPVVAGNVAQTIANLTALRAEISANPKPSYSVHGHAFDFVELYKFIGDEIDRAIRQLNQLQPYEFVSIAR